MNDAEAEYLYTEPPFAKDLDVWARNSPENAERVYRALAAFGAPLRSDSITAETFTGTDVVYQIGIAPVRIDICTHIDGVTFDEASPRRAVTTIFGLPTRRQAAVRRMWHTSN